MRGFVSRVFGSSSSRDLEGVVELESLGLVTGLKREHFGGEAGVLGYDFVDLEYL